jgi:hypothetical protein
MQSVMLDALKGGWASVICQLHCVREDDIEVYH